MRPIAYRIRQLLQFYFQADTRYQVHSPLVYELANAVLEDRRWYYAFRDIEVLRAKMLHSAAVLEIDDYGAAAGAHAPLRRQVPLKRLAGVSASSACQGRLLFRLAQWIRPERMLELGTSTGIGALYLAAGARRAAFCSLEGSEACAQVARTNLDILGFGHVQIVSGPFRRTLQPALEALGQADLVFFDGHHDQAALLQYVNQCLEHAGDQSVFIFDDVYWSPAMTAAWAQIQQHPRVTLTVDFYDLALAFFTPDVREKQHFRLVRTCWKPWKKWTSVFG